MPGVATPSPSDALVVYDVTDAGIAETKRRFGALSADTSQGYEKVRKAIAVVRETRGKVERRRVELKADALSYGRAVDAKAKELTALLMDIEEPLKTKKAAVDDEKARVKSEVEAAEQRALEAQILAKREAQGQIDRAAREEEARRLESERAALAEERAKLAEDQQAQEERTRVERERLEAERKAQADALAQERDALEAERRSVAAARAESERREAERVAAERAAREDAERVVREQLEAERAAKKAAALRPDIEKVKAFVTAIRGLVAPDVQSVEAKRFVSAALSSLAVVAGKLNSAIQEVE